MLRSPARKLPATVEPKPFSFTARLKEISMFFDGRSKQHKTMRRLVQNLEKAGIAYAILGGMAVNAHRHERTTKDVDVLVTQAGFNEFRRRFVPRTYDPVPGHPRRFFDRRHDCTFDLLQTGLYPGSGKPGPIAFPDPATVSERIENKLVVTLATLIELKLAAGRLGDYYDVVSLMRVHQLDEAFLPRLHPAVHQDFLQYLEEMKREDAYEINQDRQVEQLIRAAEPTKYTRTPRKKKP